jgi:hypothetical protein
MPGPIGRMCTVETPPRSGGARRNVPQTHDWRLAGQGQAFGVVTQAVGPESR